jgi:hypothetical protein
MLSARMNLFNLMGDCYYGEDISEKENSKKSTR